MERFYDIAGLRLRLIVPEGYFRPEGGVMERFSVSGGFDHTVEFTITDRLDPPVGELVYSDPGKRVFRQGDRQLRYEGPVERSLEGAYLRIDRTGRRSVVQVERSAIPAGITDNLIQSVMEAEHLIVRSDGFLLHASVVAYRGRAIMFTAPSGVGKSTQAELWKQLRGAETVNGDRAAVRGGTVWGIPFCGSSGITQSATLPIAAIVYLQQAPQTAIRRIEGLEAFRLLWEGCSVNVWDREDMARCAEAVTRTVASVPVFLLGCTPDESAIVTLEKEAGL